MQILRDVENDLGDLEKRGAALRTLEGCFGGMGSLNDVYISEANGDVPAGMDAAQANVELSRLLDECYKELRLLNTPFWARALWRYLSWRNRKDVPPRIRRAFR